MNKVSVILIAYHGDRWLPACLESLSEASTGRLHLVLVDNAGNRELDRLDFRPFRTEILATPRPMGFAEANNFALVHAEDLGEVVLFLNQDTISTPGWIDRCLACLEEQPAIGAVSPLIRNYEDQGWDPSFLSCFPDKQLLDSGGSSYVLTPLAPAPALMVRTEVLRQTGPFDPIFGSYYEDYDLCHRIRAAGRDIAFCCEGRLRHYSGSTTDTREKELRRMRLILRNRLIYKLRTSGQPRWQVLLRHFFLDLPYRLGRGLARTSSSQPPAVILQANGDVLRLLPRLITRQRDEAAWRLHLKELHWNEQLTTQKMTP